MIGRQAMTSVDKCAHGFQDAPTRRCVLYSRTRKTKFVRSVSYPTDCEKIINQIAVQQVRTLETPDAQILPAERPGPTFHGLENVHPSLMHPLGKKRVEVVGKKTILDFLGIARGHEIDQITEHNVNPEIGRPGVLQGALHP